MARPKQANACRHDTAHLILQVLRKPFSMTNLRRELASRNRTIEYNHLKKHVTDLIASGFVEYHGIKPRTAKHRLGERRTKSWTMGEIRHRFNAKYITTKRGEEYISQFNKLEEFFYEYWEQCN